MRFLLISDTHGQLGFINEIVNIAQAEAVIHAGDFGFYDESSYERLSERELRLHITHSDLTIEDKERIQALPQSARIAATRQECPLSEFPLYLSGEESFDVPVYAVWGNHEDKEIVEKIFHGDIQVKNLHVLHHRVAYRVGPVLIYGIGGNFLKGSRLLQRPIAGGAGKIWSTLRQYSDLIETIEKEPDNLGVHICVSHVSPGKEPFVELVAARTRADFTVSGHMGAPTCMIWNPFAISSVEEAMRRLQHGLEQARKESLGDSRSNSEWADEVFSFIGRIPKDMVHIGRGKKAPRWYREMTHINLPDAPAGYAVMDVEGTSTAIQTSTSPLTA